jgi:hypothetical protein
MTGRGGHRPLVTVTPSSGGPRPPRVRVRHGCIGARIQPPPRLHGHRHHHQQRTRATPNPDVALEIDASRARRGHRQHRAPPTTSPCPTATSVGTPRTESITVSTRTRARPHHSRTLRMATCTRKISKAARRPLGWVTHRPVVELWSGSTRRRQRRGRMDAVYTAHPGPIWSGGTLTRSGVNTHTQGRVCPAQRRLCFRSLRIRLGVGNTPNGNFR